MFQTRNYKTLNLGAVARVLQFRALAVPFQKNLHDSSQSSMTLAPSVTLASAMHDKDIMYRHMCKKKSIYIMEK